MQLTEKEIEALQARCKSAEWVVKYIAGMHPQHPSPKFHMAEQVAYVHFSKFPPEGDMVETWQKTQCPSCEGKGVTGSAASLDPCQICGGTGEMSVKILTDNKRLTHDDWPEGG